MSEDKQPHENEIGRLKELILKSGFPLEIRISSFLTEQCKLIDKLTDISTRAYYLDKDEEKGRELDIKVCIPVESEKRKESPMIFLNLLIQCKNIPGNAWVFFKSPHKVSGFCKSTSILDAVEWIPRQHVGFLIDKELHFWRLPLVTQYDEYVLKKDTSNKRDDNLFQAVISLVKALSYELETSVRQNKGMLERFSEEDLQELPPDHAEIFYPIVVFNGKMYLAQEVGKGKEMSLTPVDHVGLFQDYVSGSYDIELVVDILHERAFARFFKTIIKDIEIWRNALDGDIGMKFKKEVLKALRWYMSKRDARLRTH